MIGDAIHSPLTSFSALKVSELRAYKIMKIAYEYMKRKNNFLRRRRESMLRFTTSSKKGLT